MCQFFRKKKAVEQIDIELIEKNEKSNMNHVVESIFLAKSLYDTLKTKCHPDRFVSDEELMKKADNIFKEISESQRNYNKLKELSEIAKTELGIKI